MFSCLKELVWSTPLLFKRTSPAKPWLSLLKKPTKDRLSPFDKDLPLLLTKILTAAVISLFAPFPPVDKYLETLFFPSPLVDKYFDILFAPFPPVDKYFEMI